MKTRKSVLKILAASLLPLLFLAVGFGLLLPRRAVSASEEEPFAVQTSKNVWRTFASFDEALRSAPEEGGLRTLYVLAGEQVPVDGTISIASGKVRLESVTKTGNGWSVDGAATLVRASGNTGALFEIGGGASLTLANITLSGGGEAVSHALLEVKGELCVSDGAYLKNNLNSAGTGDAVTVFAGASLTVSGGKLSAGKEGGRAIHVCEGGAISVTGSPVFNQNTVYLDDGVTLDLTGYRGSKLSAEVSPERGDGAIATRTGSSRDALEDLISVGVPSAEGYLEEHEFTARYARVIGTESGEEFGFGGFGVDVSQTDPAKRAAITVTFTDPIQSAALSLGGKRYPLAEEGGSYIARVELPADGNEIAAWSVSVNYGGGEREKPLSRPLGYVTVNASAGTFSAPAGTRFKGKDGMWHLFPENNVIPNELGLDAAGVAEFEIGGRTRSVFVGVRAVIAEGADYRGGLYDARNDSANASLFIEAAEGYEYTLYQKDTGAFYSSAYGILWKNVKSSEYEGVVLFSGLLVDTEYVVVVRALADAEGGLPSDHKDVCTVRTLKTAEDTLRTDFVNRFTEIGMGEPTPAMIEGALRAYGALTEVMQGYPSLLEKLGAVKLALPDAFAGEWHEKYDPILSLEIGEDEENYLAALDRIREADGAYDGMEEHIRTALHGLITDEECGAAAQKVREMLREAHAKVIGQARVVAGYRLQDARGYALLHFGLADDSAAMDALQAYGEYRGLVAGCDTLAGMDSLVAEGRAMLLLEAYCALRAEKFAILPETAETEAKEPVRAAEDGEKENAAYEAMLGLYREYALSVLRPDLDMVGFETLFAREREGIEGVRFTDLHTKEELFRLEGEIDLIVAEARVLQGVQAYYNGLFEETEGRLSANGLSEEDGDVLASALYAAFEAVEAASDGSEDAEKARSEAALAGEITLYRTLASLLLAKSYAQYAEPSAPLTALYGSEKERLAEAGEGLDLAAAEDAIENVCESAVQKLALRSYYDGLAAAHAELAPEENLLENLYLTVDGAPMSEKAASASEGMVSLYRAYGHLAAAAKAGETAAQDASAVTQFQETANTQIDAVSYSEERDVSACESEIDAALEGLGQKLLVQEYFEKLDAHDAAVLQAREDYLGEGGKIDKAATAEEKRAAGELAMRAVYEAYVFAALQAHFDETYAGSADETLTALLEEAKARLAEIGSGEGFEEEMDAVCASAKYKLALRAYYNALTAEGKPNAAYPAAGVDLMPVLENAFSQIDGAAISQKEYAAYTGMFGLYLAYGRGVLERILQTRPSQSGLIGQIYAGACAELDGMTLAEGEDYASRLSAAEHAVSVLIENFDGETKLTAYYETLVLLTDEEDRATLGEKLAELVLAVKGEELGQKLPREARAEEELLETYLVLLDGEREKVFGAAKEAARAEIENAYADHPADETLKAALGEIRASYLARLEEIVYEKYDREGPNADPAKEDYLNGLTEKISALCAQAERALAVCVADSLLDAFCASLSEELSSYTLSRLASIDKEEVGRALAQAQETAKAALSEAEDCFEEEQIQQLAVRTVYAEAVLAAYAKLFEISDVSDGNAQISAAQTDAEKNGAMFAALSAVYAAQAAASVQTENAFYESALACIGETVCDGASDAALAACEAQIGAYLETAAEQTRLFLFYGSLLKEQQLDGDALGGVCEQALSAIGEAAAGKKAEKAEEGIRALAASAFGLYKDSLCARLKEADEETASLEILYEEQKASVGSDASLLLEKEKVLLCEYVRCMRFEDTLSDMGAPLYAELLALLGGMEQETAAIASAQTLQEANGMAAQLLGGWAKELLETLYADIVRASIGGEIPAEIAAEKDALLSTLTGDVSAQTAYGAAANLLACYARASLSAALAEDDPQSLKDLAEKFGGEIEGELHGVATLQDVADGATSLHETLRVYALAIGAERLLLRCGYTAKSFAEIGEDDAAPIGAMLAAYNELSDGALKAYFDGQMKGMYPSFGDRLADESDKAAFEGARAETLAAISSLGQDGGLAAERTSEYGEEVRSLEFLPVYERDEGDGFHEKEVLLSELGAWAAAEAELAHLQTERCAALAESCQREKENAFVRYGDDVLEELSSVCASAQDSLLSVRPDRSLEIGEAVQEASAQIEEIFAQGTAELGGMSAIAVSKGVRADGTGAYPADCSELWGVIENKDGIPSSARPHFDEVVAGSPVGAGALVGDKICRSVFEIYLDGVDEFRGVYTVKILLTEEISAIVGAQVLALGENGAPELLQTRVEGKWLVFETSHFSTFYLYGEREVNLWWLIFVLTFILLIELVVIVLLSAKLYRRAEARRSERLLSLAPAALLAVLIPDGAAVVSIVLGVLIVLSAIAIGGLLYALYRKPKSARKPVEKSDEPVEEEPVPEEEPVEEPVEEEPVPEEEPVEEPAEEPADEPFEIKPVFEEGPEELPEEIEEAEPYEQLTIFDLPEEAEPEPGEEAEEQLSIFDLPVPEPEEPRPVVVLAEPEPEEQVFEEPVEEAAEGPIPEEEPEIVEEIFEEPVEENLPEEEPVEEAIEEPLPEEEPEVVEEIFEEPVEEILPEEEPEPVEENLPEEEPVEEPAEEFGCEEEPAWQVVPVQAILADEPEETTDAFEPEEQDAGVTPVCVIEAEEPEPEEELVPEEEPATEVETEASETTETAEPAFEEELVPEEESTSAEEPVSEEEPAPAEESTSTEEPVLAEEPVTEEPVPEEEPAPAEEAVTEEPVSEEEPECVPSDEAEPPCEDELVVAEESTPVEEPVLTEESVPTEEPVSEEEPVPTEEPVSEEEPVPTEQPVHEAEVETRAYFVWRPVIVPEDVPEEYRLPEEEMRGEVAASEVNGLMQDDTAKTLIEVGERVANKQKTAIVNVDTLGEYFENGEKVTLEELKKRIPYFNKKVTFVKVLARGRLNKALVVEGDDFSLEAVKMIAITGGHVIRTRRK